MDMDKALQTQLANIEKLTGKTVAELVRLARASGLAKHGEVRDLMKKEYGMGHGDANVVAHLVFHGAVTETKSSDEASDTIYTGPKAALRAIHDKIMTAVAELGPFEIAPKKTYLSLRRKKQFAMVGPATNSRVEVGLNMKGVDGTPRLEALPPGGMCQYKVRLTSVSDVDAELLAWIRRAYDQSA